MRKTKKRIRQLSWVLILGLCLSASPVLASEDAPYEGGTATEVAPPDDVVSEQIPIGGEAALAAEPDAVSALVDDETAVSSPEEPAAPPAETGDAEELLPESPDADAQQEAPIPVHLLALALDGDIEGTPLRYSEDVVQRRLLAQRETYYEGLPWNIQKVYKGGTGCLGFVWMLSDILFDDLPSRRYARGSFSFDDLHVGDYLREGEPSGHTVMILEKYDDHVVLVEGNFWYYPYSYYTICWHRQQTKSAVMSEYVVMYSRYPIHLAGDVTSDRIIGADDAAQLLRLLVGYRTDQDTAAADANGDSSVNASDASAILGMNAMKEDGLMWRTGE